MSATDTNTSGDGKIQSPDELCPKNFSGGWFSKKKQLKHDLFINEKKLIGITYSRVILSCRKCGGSTDGIYTQK